VSLDEQPVLDSVAIAELRAATGDDDEFLQDLIGTYIAEAPANLEAMAAALAAADPAAIVRPSHTLKSSSASIGAMRLSSICRTIEETGRSGRLDGLDAAVASAAATWTATLEALSEAGFHA
jgi:two-component system sensor histidine kinase/response regulator